MGKGEADSNKLSKKITPPTIATPKCQTRGARKGKQASMHEEARLRKREKNVQV